jgi:hypothetical protein
MDKERNPVWPWIATVLIGLPMLYVASFGPACWITSHLGRDDSTVETAYLPIFWAWDFLPKPIQSGLRSYGTLGAADGWGWIGTNYINWRDPHLQMQFRWGNARRSIRL